MNIKLLLSAAILTGITIANVNAQNVGIGTSAPSSRLEIVGTGSTPTSSAFHVKNSSGTSLFTIKDNGSVGINSSSPGATLDIKGGLKLTETGTGNGYVGFFAAMGSGATFYTWPGTDGISGQVLTTNGMGYLSWTTPGGGSTGSTINCSTTSNTNYTVRGIGSGAWECTSDLQVNSSGYVSINTTPTSSYRLRVSGNLGLGSSPPSSSYVLSVDGDGYIDGGLRLGYGLGVGTSDPSSGLYVGSSSNFYVPTSIGSSSGTDLVISSGRIYKLSSSIKYKENVKPLTFNKENFLKINPVSFNYKKEYGNPNKREVGVIAEDVEKLIPDLVVYEQKQVFDASGKPVLDENGQEVYETTNIPESVKYNMMPVYLISIAAEQEQRINSLTQEVEALKQQIKVLETMMSEIKSNK